MKTYFAYQAEKEHGPFREHLDTYGDEFFTSNSTHAGATLFVISGHYEPRAKHATFKLEGKFRIRQVRENDTGRAGFEDKKNYLTLERLAYPASPIVLEDSVNFSREEFRKNYVRRGLVEAPHANLIDYFDQLLSISPDLGVLAVIDDLAEIDSDDDLSETEKQEMRRARVGQGQFRKNTIALWGNEEKCAVTGLEIRELLNASHIIPWRDCISKSDRLGGYNGIILSVHLDRLFDRFLIGFEKSPRNPDIRPIVFAPKLKDQISSLAAIGITRALQLNLQNVKFADQPRLNTNLDRHLERVKKNTS